MFGMRHFDPDHAERWAGKRSWRRRHGHGFGDRHGFGGGDMIRAGRMLATGDLRLIALALIAEQPRHGYEIIKVLEDKTAGWYSPSPGIVYPTLTFLEEAGYVTAQTEGAKKLYSITDDGRAYLDQNRDFVDAVLERLEKIGSKIARVRRRFGRDEEEDDERRGLPPLLRAALENLREIAGERLGNDADAEAKLVEILARAAQEMKKA
ncbi:MAG TPA: PadR family transcriptional regulator [Xanthobacteraceae bacterium]|nr:PadR family transcriptional regulator [Xanthobacteraceae bacterium]